MKRMKGKRWLALWLAAVLVLSLSPLNMTFAEEIPVVESAPAAAAPEPEAPKAEEPKTEEPKAEAPNVEESKTETPEPEKEPAPEITDAPAATPAPAPTQEVPVITPAPEAIVTATPAPDAAQTASPSAAPETGATPEVSAEPTPDASAGPDPEASAAPSPEVSAEPSPDASVEPSPSPEATQEPIVIEQDLYETWYGVVNSSEQGMDIPRYFQTDYPETVCTIRGIPRSVASSGCGPTSLSMVIAYLTGNTEQTPSTLFVDAFNAGLYVGAGWNHNMLTYYARLYGLKTQWISNDGDAIIQALQEGKPIIAHMGPGIFTEQGHYVVLRGVTSSGKILLNDPVSPTKCGKAFPVQTLLAQAKGGSSFMVCWVEDEEEAAPAPEIELTEIETGEAVAEATATPQPTEMPTTLAEVRAEITQEPFAEFGAEVIADMVNLRDAPGRGKAVTLLPKGSILRIVERKTMESGATWYGVLYDGQTLYLRGDYVAPVEMPVEDLQAMDTAVIPEPEPTAAPTLAGLAAMATLTPMAEPTPMPTPEPPGPTEDGVFDGAYLARVSYPSVNLRMLPGEEGLIVCSVPEGTSLCVTAELTCAGDGYVWCRVIYQRQNLYMRGDMLTPLS